MSGHLLLLALLAPPPVIVRGTVVAAVGTTPIANAVVTARASRVSAVTDPLGRWQLALAILPDTVIVAAIGWKPDTVAIAAPPAAPVTIALNRAPAMLSDLIATAPRATAPEIAGLGRWRMPMAAARTVPPAIETDVYRALALIPAINFSSPLSARPLLRGYDAQDVTTRIDGFEVVNIYHLGRIFSSFPADAAETITVSAAPYTSGHGGAVAGLIDIDGRVGRRGDFQGGGGLSYGALSAYAGGGGNRIRTFGTARLFYWKSLELIPQVEIPYRFEDFYGGAVIGSPDRPRGRFTVFATEDRAGRPADGKFLDWSNLLAGTRWRVLDRGSVTIEVSASATRSRQRGEDVPGAHTLGTADLANRFDRVRSTVELIRSTGPARAAVGVAAGYRSIGNRIRDHRAATEQPVALVPPADWRSHLAESAAWASYSRRGRRFAAEAAVHADVAGAVRSLEPRLHLRWFAGAGVEVAAGLGRTSRLYHVLSEARSEPDFDFLDFWLDASDSIPAARADHATFDVSAGSGPWAGRVSLYASRASGMGELRPDTDQRGGGYFRFGQARTLGLELQIGYRGAAHHPFSASASWAWARSERNWEGDWVRWALDRRHQLRGFGQWRTGRIDWFAAIDASTGTPLTPVDAFITDPGVPGVPAGAVAGRPPAVAVYGRENSAATSGTFRLDAGIAYAFGGPSRRFTLGVSVINLLATAVAPFGNGDGPGTGPLATAPNGAPAPYRRMFTLPPIPTLTLRGEF